MVNDVDILRHIRFHQEEEKRKINQDNAPSDEVCAKAEIKIDLNNSKNETQNTIDDKHTPAFVKLLTKRVFEMIFEEVNTSDSQMLIKRKIITPVINMIYVELYPYIIAMIVSILTILILSSLTFVGFIFYFIKR